MARVKKPSARTPSHHSSSTGETRQQSNVVVDGVPKFETTTGSSSITSNINNNEDENDIPSLTVRSMKKTLKLFIGVKLVLFLIIYFTPFIYDTSSYTPSLLFETDGTGTIFGSTFGHLIRKLTIWDNVFFSSAASRNGISASAGPSNIPSEGIEGVRKLPGRYLYEHEWAFGYGWMQIIQILGLKLYTLTGSKGERLYYFSAAAILLGNISHWLACVMIYILTMKIYSSKDKPLMLLVQDYVKSPPLPPSNSVTETSKSRGYSKDNNNKKTKTKNDDENSEGESSKNLIEEQKKQNEGSLLMGIRLEKYAETIAGRTAMLYALSPAGAFLASGYSESIFALFSFIAMYFREDQKYLASGLVFAFTTVLRGNGLLWGVFHLYDLVTIAKSIYIIFTKGKNVSLSDPVKKRRQKYLYPLARHGINVIQGGGLIAVAFFGMQYLAYRVFCPGAEWCTNINTNSKLAHLPLIYSYIQSKYWNVGFLRYWTPNNIPNFLFGAPTLVIIFQSGVYFYKSKMTFSREGGTGVKGVRGVGVGVGQKTRASEYMTPYLIVAWVMFFSALFVWNVQIITRIASCLPTVYWYTAEMLTSTQLREVKIGKIIGRYFVIWIVVQGIFFASFLPPA